MMKLMKLQKITCDAAFCLRFSVCVLHLLPGDTDYREHKGNSPCKGIPFKEVFTGIVREYFDKAGTHVPSLQNHPAHLTQPEIVGQQCHLC